MTTIVFCLHGWKKTKLHSADISIELSHLGDGDLKRFDHSNVRELFHEG